MEECVESRELECSKCERMYRQHEQQQEDRILDLEGQLEALRALKLELEDQSLLVFEENEDRLRMIQDQETVNTLCNIPQY